MSGRLVEIEGIDPGFISLVDEEKRRARNIVLWETKESAEDAERKVRADSRRDRYRDGRNCPVW